MTPRALGRPPIKKDPARGHERADLASLLNDGSRARETAVLLGTSVQLERPDQAHSVRTTVLTPSARR
jgi:hypothetical protein